MHRHPPRLVTAFVIAGLLTTVTACSLTSQTTAAAGQTAAANGAAAGGQTAANGAAANGAAAGGQASAACAGGPGSSATHTIDAGGRTRTFIEHLPAGFAAGAKYPAIIAFPGRGESSGQLEAYSQLDSVDAIVIYAQALPGAGGQTAWEATPFQGAVAHDYEFAADLVGWLAGSSCVDANRIDMTGKSDGAGFALSAACGLSGVAAVATVSGAFYQQQNHCVADGRPLALLIMEGTADPVIPYDGNAAEGLYSADAWIRQWLLLDQCSGSQVQRNIAPGVVQSVAQSCADGTAVINYTIIGGGHTWPGATVPSGPGNTTDAIDAAQVMAAFFASHPAHGD
jgi:polyhydroxybutyrate depolymerase